MLSLDYFRTKVGAPHWGAWDLKSLSELAFHFECHWVAKRGCPCNMIMDRDTKFTSANWRDFMEALGITAMLTTTYHQQSDGQTEGQIATLAD